MNNYSIVIYLIGKEKIILHFNVFYGTLFNCMKSSLKAKDLN